MKKFILIINGPICAGKSTVSELLLSNIPNSFRVSWDKIKWFVGGYNKEKHREVTYRLTLALAKQAISEGFSLIVDGNGRFSKNSVDEYKIMAKKNKYKFIEVNIEAPLNILIDRFKNRIVLAKKNKSKISLTTVKQMKEGYSSYQEYKNNTLITFNSNKDGKKKISNEIIKLINQKL